MTALNQPNNQPNNQNQNSKPTPSKGSDPLQNKAQNEPMIGNLKNLDSKLETSGKQMKNPESNEGKESKELESDDHNKHALKDMNLSMKKFVDFAKDYFKKEATAPYLGKLGSEVGEQVVDFVQDWSEKNNANLSVTVTGVTPSTPTYTGVGAAAGAGLGYAFGGKVGTALGLLFGAALGAGISCVHVKFHSDEATGAAKSAPVVH